ncbi:MAG: 8-amino-7-oxononanoate synthase, partial [candidate division WOR-3 bacterium]
IYVNPVVPPGVPPGDSLLRTSCMATHTDEHIEKGLEIFKKVGKKLGVI